jgi:hypothetical protein
MTSYDLGPGFLGTLTIAFIVLKLTRHIDWHWLWVLSPILISGAVIIIILLVIWVIYLINWTWG